MSCGVGRGHGSDPVFLWLWCRPAAVAQIRPLAWEPPYAIGAALKTTTTKTSKETEQRQMDRFGSGERRMGTDR